MSPFRTRLLLAVLVFLGVALVFVRLLDSEPEPDRNPFVCPDCGKMLTEKNAKCLYCEGKKNLEKLEAARNANSNAPKSETKMNPDKRNKAIAAGIAFAVLMAVAFWPSIHRYIRSRQAPADIEYRICRCPRCRRKLRYRAATIGTQGMCPTCKELFNFPEGEEDTGEDF